VTSFDLYSTSNAPLTPDQLRPGQRLSLDGIDGFYDQYFEGRKRGEVIDFLVWPYVLATPAIAAEELATLPLVSAEVVEADALGGTVDVIRVHPFGAWLRALPPQSEVPIDELEATTKAPVAALVAEASRAGSSAWKSNPRGWEILHQVTAVYFVQVSPERLRAAVLRKHGAASVADIVAGAA
jgi:hypothetical protein